MSTIDSGHLEVGYVGLYSSVIKLAWVVSTRSRTKARMCAHSDENGHRFRRKAATCSDPKRPLWPGVDLGGMIVTVG